MIEILSLIAIVAFFFALSIFQRWRRDRRDRANSSRALGLKGKKVQDARAWLGEPTEIVFGASGSRLYLWKLDEIEVVLTIGPDDTIMDTVAKRVC